MRLEFRRYQESDRERILALHTEQELAIGREMDLPSLSDHPVLISEVGVNGKGIEGAHFLESIPEYSIVSRSALFTKHAMLRAPQIIRTLRANGFRMVRIPLPKCLGKDGETLSAALSELFGADRVLNESSNYDLLTVDFR